MGTDRQEPNVAARVDEGLDLIEAGRVVTQETSTGANSGVTNIPGNVVTISLPRVQRAEAQQVAAPMDKIIAESEIDEEELKAALEYLRPALLVDGGDVRLVAIQGGNVLIELLGACGGCPLSELTVLGGIERILAARVVGFESLETV